jgi:hypothetical protein
MATGSDRKKIPITVMNHAMRSPAVPLPSQNPEAGCVTPATVADHIEPHRGDFTEFRLGPLRSLCADCHNGLDRNNAPRAPGPRDGTDPNHPWNAAPPHRERLALPERLLHLAEGIVARQPHVR